MVPSQPRSGHSPASQRLEAVHVPRPIDANAASIVSAVWGKRAFTQVEPSAEHASMQSPPGALATKVTGEGADGGGAGGYPGGAAGGADGGGESGGGRSGGGDGEADGGGGEGEADGGGGDGDAEGGGGDGDAEGGGPLRFPAKT